MTSFFEKCTDTVLLGYRTGLTEQPPLLQIEQLPILHAVETALVKSVSGYYF